MTREPVPMPARAENPPQPIAQDPVRLAQEQALGTLQGQAEALLSSAVAGYRRMHAAIWDHPDLTPQQVVADLGDRAASVFNRTLALAVFISQQSPSTPLPGVPEGWTLQFNADGTMVVTPPTPPGAPAQ